MRTGDGPDLSINPAGAVCYKSSLMFRGRAPCVPRRRRVSSASSRRPASEAPMTRTLLLPALALLLLTLPPGPGRGADEDDPELGGHKLSEYLQLLKKLQAEKPASDKENEANIQKRQ